MRQATISNVERGRSQPNLALLAALCRFFDVSPAWLLDPEAPLVPGPRDRWSLHRAALVPGTWIECRPGDLVRTKDGCVLAPIAPGARYWTREGRDLRLALDGEQAVARALAEAEERRRSEERRLVRELRAELGLHPRRRAQPEHGAGGRVPEGGGDPEWKPV